jgi:predicted amidohydrolase
VRDIFYNSSVFISPDREISVYRKAHLFYKEKLVFSNGNTHFPVYNTSIGKIGVMICFDWIFPEVCRSLALKGAEIICQPANLVLPHCPLAMRVRSIENRIFTVTANRIGSEEKKEKSLLL